MGKELVVIALVPSPKLHWNLILNNNNNAVIYTNFVTSYNKHRSKDLDKWRKSFATTIHCSIVCEASIICVVGVLPSLTALNATSGAWGRGEMRAPFLPDL